MAIVLTRAEADAIRDRLEQAYARATDGWTEADWQALKERAVASGHATPELFERFRIAVEARKN